MTKNFGSDLFAWFQTYEGDVQDLGLNFTIVSEEFGRASEEELKPGLQCYKNFFFSLIKEEPNRPNKLERAWQTYPALTFYGCNV
jgi:hypothetical protein